MAAPARLVTIVLCLALAVAACGGGEPVEVVMEDASEAPSAPTDDGATPVAELDEAKPGQRGELSIGDDKQEPELGTVAAGDDGAVAVNAGAPAAHDGRLCAVLPTGQIDEVLGGDSDVQDNTPDTCVYTRLMGGEAVVATITRTDVAGEFPFQTLIESQAEQLDSDGTAEVMDGLGDEAYVLDGNIGTYVHALAGDLYVIVFVTGPINTIAAAESLMRIALGG